MYVSRPGLLVGFHGCERALRDNVVSGRVMLRPSENGYDWLGEGIYFWESNLERAKEFSLIRPGKARLANPAVLGAVIDLQLCLDLLDTRFLKLMKGSYENIVTSVGAENEQIPRNRDAKGSADRVLRHLDYAVIENLHNMQRSILERPFDSVRGVFVEGEELYPGAGFHEKNHIQICIRNPNCIKGFFVPRSETDWKG